MLQHSVQVSVSCFVFSFSFILRRFSNTSIFFQAIQHAHSFSMQSFENRQRLGDMKREVSALKKDSKSLESKMKKLEDQAEAATKAQQMAEEKAESA